MSARITEKGAGKSSSTFFLDKFVSISTWIVGTGECLSYTTSNFGSLPAGKLSISLSNSSWVAGSIKGQSSPVGYLYIFDSFDKILMRFSHCFLVINTEGRLIPV